MTGVRKETDSRGEVAIPADDKLCCAQTQQLLEINVCESLIIFNVIHSVKVLVTRFRFRTLFFCYRLSSIQLCHERKLSMRLSGAPR